MLLTADNVRNQEFTLARKGYHEGEVDTFLDEVILTIEERDAEIVELTERLRVYEEQGTAEAASTIDPASAVGSNAAARLLELAQKIATEHVTTAEGEAAALLVRAREEAAEIAGAARLDAKRIMAESESERSRILAAMRDDQAQIRETRAALSVSAQEVRAELERYLTGLLAKVHEPEPTRLSALHG